MKQNSPVDIEAIYNNYLDNKQEENYISRYKDREHFYHASGAGSCSRKLYFESVIQAEATEALIGALYESLSILEPIKDWLIPFWEKKSKEVLLMVKCWVR